ncbi:MAG TPA: hypothetical protein PL167_13875 [Cyclobacteriaceae bacterium]|nr:hypothetical protein [Cyclobacteriaceae bacterium]
MSTIIITPGTKKQFDLTFDLLAALVGERKSFTLDGKAESAIDFAFLMKEMDSTKEVVVNASGKKK